jgi:hypothetical protein
MPTEVKSYVGSSASWTALSASDKAYYTDSGGSNYTTPQLWDDDYGNTTGNLVADDEIAIAELNAEDFIGQLIIRSGWTTNETHYTVIRARVGSEYNHVTDTGAKIFRNADNGLKCYQPYTRFERIRIGSFSYERPIYGHFNNSIDCRSCTILSSGRVADRSVSGLYLRACLIIVPSYNLPIISNYNLRNCTIICNNTYGYITQYVNAYNTVIYNQQTSTTLKIYGAFTTGDYNAQSESDEAAPPGANSIDDVPSTAFNDYGNSDYTLSGINSELYHTGTPTYAPELDNNGVAFDALTPSIGAFEFVVVVPAPATIDVTKNNGTTIGISSSLPTTFDADSGTGYASITFTDIGEVIDIGEISKTYKAINHQSASRLHPQKIKDTFDISNVPLTLGRVSANTGQIEIQSALMSYASVSFEVVLPSGDIGNFTGKVMKAGLATISYGSISTTLVDISIDANTLFEA